MEIDKDKIVSLIIQITSKSLLEDKLSPEQTAKILQEFIKQDPEYLNILLQLFIAMYSKTILEIAAAKYEII